MAERIGKNIERPSTIREVNLRRNGVLIPNGHAISRPIDMIALNVPGDIASTVVAGEAFEIGVDGRIKDGRDRMVFVVRTSDDNRNLSAVVISPNGLVHAGSDLARRAEQPGVRGLGVGNDLIPTRGFVRDLENNGGLVVPLGTKRSFGREVFGGYDYGLEEEEGMIYLKPDGNILLTGLRHEGDSLVGYVPVTSKVTPVIISDL